jgi:glutamate-5-semialdehyde dehydrogenase
MSVGQELLHRAKNASRDLVKLEEVEINNFLQKLSYVIQENVQKIILENQKDLVKMDPQNPKYDRLKLTEERIETMTKEIRTVAGLPGPLNQTLEQRTLPNLLEISRISVPLGVIAIIYESRPNVTTDVFALCLKAGSSCILKGGSDAFYSNTVLVNIIKELLEKEGLNPDFITLLPAERESINLLFKANNLVDVIIPRGSQQLINFVRENSKVPVIETGAGVCHTYYDEFGDPDKVVPIIVNAKTRRVSVCNALDCMIIHESRLPHLPAITQRLKNFEIAIKADERAYRILESNYPGELLHKAKKEDFGQEFLGYKMAIKTVANINEAVEHINNFGSGHSEAIISENQENIHIFQKQIDAAAVYANASTAFTDGAQFGLGSEIGISTQKLHARGPMGLRELTSYKWIISGNGQIRYDSTSSCQI